jgi:predicted ester cyclase
VIDPTDASRVTVVGLMAKSSTARMSIERNKLTVRAFVAAAYCRGDLAAIDVYLAPDFVDHNPVSGLPPDRDGLRLLFAALRTAFPDLQATIHDQVAENDKVVTRKTLTGTHEGPFMGLRPTGNRVSFEVIDILRLADDKVIERWCVVDQLALLRTLRAPPQSGARRQRRLAIVRRRPGDGYVPS